MKQAPQSSPLLRRLVARAVAALAMDEAPQVALMRGAGIAFIDPEGRALFLKRGAGGDHPGEWCFPGGGIEPGEIAEDAALREAMEEIGANPYGEREPLAETDHDGVNYTTFRQRIARAFTPRLNDEHTEHAWLPLDKPPEPLHPGVAKALQAIGIAAEPAKQNPDDDGSAHPDVVGDAASEQPQAAERPTAFEGFEFDDDGAPTAESIKAFAALYGGGDDLTERIKQALASPDLMQQLAGTSDAPPTTEPSPQAASADAPPAPQANDAHAHDEQPQGDDLKALLKEAIQGIRTGAADQANVAIAAAKTMAEAMTAAMRPAMDAILAQAEKPPAAITVNLPPMVVENHQAAAPAPVVNVAPAGPSIVVQPSPVHVDNTVNVPEGPRDMRIVSMPTRMTTTEVERDRNDDIKSTRQVQRDKE